MDIIPFTKINLTLSFVNNLTALEEDFSGIENFGIHRKVGFRASSRIRTNDTRITNAMLYQLSYGGFVLNI